MKNMETHAESDAFQRPKGHYVKPIPALRDLHKRRILLRTGAPDTATGCMEWSGSRIDGYGVIILYGKLHRAHRVAYAMHVGQIPPDKPYVLHRCDNPACVNPEHLFAGTGDDNVKDMCAKKRNAMGATHGWQTKPESRPRGMRSGAYTKPEKRPRGVGHGCHKLSDSDVIEIRRLADSGELHRDIAAKFGISKGNVGFISRRETWTHIS